MDSSLLDSLRQYSPRESWVSQARLGSCRPDMQATWPSRWLFYDHVAERQPNACHPVHLKAPLLEILCCSETVEEQQKWIVVAERESVQLLPHGGMEKVIGGCDAVAVSFRPKAAMPAKAAGTFIGDMWHARRSVLYCQAILNPRCFQ